MPTERRVLPKAFSSLETEPVPWDIYCLILRSPSRTYSIDNGATYHGLFSRATSVPIIVSTYTAGRLIHLEFNAHLPERIYNGDKGAYCIQIGCEHLGDGFWYNYAACSTISLIRFFKFTY